MKKPIATGTSARPAFELVKTKRHGLLQTCSRRRCVAGIALFILVYLWGAVGWISFHLDEPSSSILQRLSTPTSPSKFSFSQSNWSQTVWRYDELPIAWEPLPFDVPLLPCVPSEYRLPENWKETLMSPNTATPLSSSRDYLFDYNPSLVRIPISATMNQHPTAHYVASFRVSNQHYCLHPTDRQQLMGISANNQSKSNPHKDYLGLALLQDDGQILQSVVVDLTKAGFPAAQDFRLFELHNQLYVSSYDLIAPLWLDERERMSVRKRNQQIMSMQQIPIVFGDWKVFVGQQPACAGCGRRNACGKNFNYIALSSDTEDEALVEVWPSAPHLLHSVQLTQPCRRMQKASQVFSTPNDPIRSFRTVESTFFPDILHSDNRGIFTRGRGSACCVSMVHPRDTQRSLWVGIQHSKTPSQKNKQDRNLEANHYVSSWYAWDAKPPHSLVAQSGYFCLPFAANDHNSATRATSWRHLKLGNASFVKCPRIHFVSGLTMDDHNRIVIAYGVNDCYSRLVRVPMTLVMQMLKLDVN